MSDAFLPAALRGTSLERSIAALDDVYARAEAAMGRFRLASGLACIGGCGECCTGFEPDIRPAEAAYLAAWLSGPEAEKARLLERDDGSGTCPFFDAEDPRHCQVYPARFLICRLFGFCAMKDKAGNLDFSLCFALANADKFRKKRWKADELLAVFGVLPPAMADFGSQAAAVEPEGIGRPEPVRKAMAEAMAKVGLAILMRKASVADEEDNPENRSA